MNPKIDAFINTSSNWKSEMRKLRKIALDCGLNEEIKWGKPCYTSSHHNIAIIQPFKEQCGFMFFKGALLSDPDGLLELPGSNSQSARRLMFSNVDQVNLLEPNIRKFIAEAITIGNTGLKVNSESSSLPIPVELDEMFKQVSGFQKAFQALTPGRQRGYIIHFSNAKQSKTRTSRIEKSIPRILKGKGIND